MAQAQIRRNHVLRCPGPFFSMQTVILTNIVKVQISGSGSMRVQRSEAQLRQNFLEISELRLTENHSILENQILLLCFLINLLMEGLFCSEIYIRKSLT